MYTEQYGPTPDDVPLYCRTMLSDTTTEKFEEDHV